MAAWQRRRFVSPLLASDSRQYHVVFPGRRSGVPGPDFRDAMLALDDGTLLHGDIEIHVRPAGWTEHGHHRNPDYNHVVLHVAGQGPAADVFRHDGAKVPTVIIMLLPMDAAPAADPPRDFEALAGLLDAAADSWFLDRMRRLEGAADTVGVEQALWAALLEAIGYGGNRAGFAALAEAVPWELMCGLLAGKPAEAKRARAEAVLLGAAGLADDGQARLWRSLGAPSSLTPIRWSRAASRPANRPEARLPAVAALAASLVPSALDDWVHRTVNEARAPLALAQTLTQRAEGLGAGRAAAIAVNVLLPFAALAGEAVPRALFARFPRLPENQITRYMTDLLFAPSGRHYVTGARRQQGMLWVYRRWPVDPAIGAAFGDIFTGGSALPGED